MRQHKGGAVRSIGKVNIKKLNKIIAEEIAKPTARTFSTFCHADVKEKIIERIPAEWFDIWESAHDEMHRIIEDALMAETYGTKRKG